MPIYLWPFLNWIVCLLFTDLLVSHWSDKCTADFFSHSLACLFTLGGLLEAGTVILLGDSLPAISIQQSFPESLCISHSSLSLTLGSFPKQRWLAHLIKSFLALVMPSLPTPLWQVISDTPLCDFLGREHFSRSPFYWINIQSYFSPQDQV